MSLHIVFHAGYMSKVVPIDKLTEALQAILRSLMASRCCTVSFSSKVHASMLELQTWFREGRSKGWRGVQRRHFSVQQHRS